MVAYIQVISGPEEGLSLVLNEGDKVQIGRGPKNGLIIAHDSYISTLHAELAFVGGVVKLLDCRSSNGSVISGRRIPAQTWYDVDTFFILGSTPFHVSISGEPQEANTQVPLRLDDASWGKSRIVAKGVEIAVARGQKHLDSVALFLAVNELFPDLLLPTFTKLRIQPKSLFDTWKSQAIFDGERQWINNFLELQFSLPKSPAVLVTPKVCHFLKSASPRRGLKPELALIEILGDRFNLCFQLLEWNRYQQAWLETKKALQESLEPAKKNAVIQPPVLGDAPTKKASIGAQIDEEIEAILKKGQIVELTGEPGCGKTRVLNRFLDAQFMRADESRDRFLPALMDIRTFLTFHTLSELPIFIKKIILALDKAPLVGIDHFDELLEIMKRELLDHDSLLSAIHQRNCQLIIAAKRSDAFRQIKLHGTRRLDVGTFSLLLRQSVLEAMMHRFERESGFRISAANRKWLNEKLWDMAANCHNVREIFDIAVSRSRDALEQRQKWAPSDSTKEELELYFFESILKVKSAESKAVEPAKPLPPPTPPEAIPVLRAPDPGSVMDFVYQVEDFIKAFVEEEFHLGLDYTDRTYSIRESGLLNQEEKLQQLKSFLVFLLTSYRESFRVWFQKFWNQIDPQVLRSYSNIGNNPKKLWAEFQQRAGKIDMALAEDQFIEMAAEAFRRSWREAKRSQVPPIPKAR